MTLQLTMLTVAKPSSWRSVVFAPMKCSVVWHLMVFMLIPGNKSFLHHQGPQEVQMWLRLLLPHLWRQRPLTRTLTWKVLPPKLWIVMMSPWAPREAWAVTFKGCYFHVQFSMFVICVWFDICHCTSSPHHMSRCSVWRLPPHHKHINTQQTASEALHQSHLLNCSTFTFHLWVCASKQLWKLWCDG